MSIEKYLQRHGKSTTFPYDLPLLPEENFERYRAGWYQLGNCAVAGWKDINPKVTEQMIRFAMRSDKFKGDWTKGLLLTGATGTGKTKYIETLNHFMKYACRQGFKIMSGLQVERTYKLPENDPKVHVLNNALDNSKMFCIDDLGEEHDRIKIFGTDINVGIDVLMRRYDAFMKHGYYTFATTNLNREMLKRKYGARIDSRIDEMFNVIAVTGNDLRKTT